METKKMNPFIVHSEKCWPSVDMVSPCEKSCPINMEIPSYVMAISQGRFDEGLEIIRKTNPLPSVCGRICHHPCEEACNRRFIDAPISIRALKRFVLDYSSFGTREPLRSPNNIQRPEKIAVIGAGPAGLTAAHDLVKLGYQLVVYESMPTPGGMLIKCIPDFILPQKVVQKEIEYLTRNGVRIKTSMALGREVFLDDLRERGFKAILLAMGSHRGLDLSLEGRGLLGIETAIDFLARNKNGFNPAKTGRFLVIGGGNVAIDVARLACRMGYEEVHLACVERREEMPAFVWEAEAAEIEGIKFHYGLAPHRFIGSLKVSGVEFRRVETFSKSLEGKLSWTLTEGPRGYYALEVDQVVIAIGQQPILEFLEDTGIQLQNGRPIVGERNFATSVPGVFVAGDVINPQGTVVEAIRDGRLAARAIVTFLNGKHLDTYSNSSEKEAYVVDKRKVKGLIPRREEWTVPKLPIRSRIRCRQEVELGYSVFEATQEANRCLNCRMCGNCIFERNQICFEQSLRLL